MRADSCTASVAASVRAPSIPDTTGDSRPSMTARTLAATLAVHESARTGAPVDLARDYALIAAAAA